MAAKPKKFDYVLGDHARAVGRLRARARRWDPVSHALFDRIGIRRRTRVVAVRSITARQRIEFTRSVQGLHQNLRKHSGIHRRI